ncbi:MAG: HlyD family secretion protein, partial [Phycisphaerae bacterium]|nr:HlyD family secretion protein [Phycisphaerae bacterium]
MIKANPTRWFPALLVAMVACLALGPIGCDRHSGHGGHGHGTHGDHKGHDHDKHDDRGGHDHAKHGEAKHGEDARTIRLSESQRKEFGVETDKATLGVLGQSVQLPGEVVINPDSRVHVVPRVSGVVRDVHKRVGDRTQANDPLLVLDSAELAEAKSDYLAKLQALELEQVDLDRTRTIHDNTLKMLELVKGQPGLDELVKLEKLDLGTNRKELLSVYADFITAKAEHGRQRTLFEDRVASQASFDAAQSRYQAALATYLATRDDMRFQNRRALDARQRRFR